MQRTLLRGAIIITLDDRLGDFTGGDILIEGERIAAVGSRFEVSDANAHIVDASDWIIAPGFINAHMHTWQTGLRAAAASWTLLEYFRWVHAVSHCLKQNVTGRRPLPHKRKFTAQADTSMTLHVYLSYCQLQCRGGSKIIDAATEDVLERASQC